MAPPEGGVFLCVLARVRHADQLGRAGIEFFGIEGDGETIDVFPSSDFAVQGLPYQSGMAITCVGRKGLGQT